MQVAALYDIHGNLPALEGVLAELSQVQPDLIVAGGDMAAGPMPRETLDRLISLGDSVRFLRGNTDREIVDHYDACSAPDTRNEDDVWAQRIEWAARQVTEAQRDLLASLPTTLTIEVDGLGATLFCHGSPRSDHEVITRVTPRRRLDGILAQVTENIVVCGHTHVQFNRTHASKRVINAGSVGLLREETPGAYWTLLGPDVVQRRTSYDLDDAARRIRATECPEADAFADDLLKAWDPARVSESREAEADRAAETQERAKVSGNIPGRCREQFRCR
ncbi:MAG TPA: metallophosphoesterase family protein [Gaiellaceae bacterium]|nr:metallophosphoesterase family protein [Gaiellaceae bacterium]